MNVLFDVPFWYFTYVEGDQVPSVKKILNYLLKVTFAIHFLHLFSWKPLPNSLHRIKHFFVTSFGTSSKSRIKTIYYPINYHCQV